MEIYKFVVNYYCVIYIYIYIYCDNDVLIVLKKLIIKIVYIYIFLKLIWCVCCDKLKLVCNNNVDEYLVIIVEV